MATERERGGGPKGGPQGGPYATMEEILIYKPETCLADIARIEKRIEALRKGEVKTSQGDVIAGVAAHEEYSRLAELKRKFEEAAAQGKISTDLWEQRQSF